MIRTAFHKGARDAADQFGLREASLMELLLGVGTPMAAKAGLNVLAPKLMPSIERGLEVPFRGLKSVGQGAMRAMRGPSTPAEALAHGLSGAPTAGAVRDPAALIAGMSRGGK